MTIADIDNNIICLSNWALDASEKEYKTERDQKATIDIRETKIQSILLLLFVILRMKTL